MVEEVLIHLRDKSKNMKLALFGTISIPVSQNSASTVGSIDKNCIIDPTLKQNGDSLSQALQTAPGQYKNWILWQKPC